MGAKKRRREEEGINGKCVLLLILSKIEDSKLMYAKAASLNSTKPSNAIWKIWLGIKVSTTNQYWNSSPSFSLKP